MDIDEEKWQSYVEALRAWYEGKKIQYMYNTVWHDETTECTHAFSTPTFGNRLWRVKPNTIKYRLTLHRLDAEAAHHTVKISYHEKYHNFFCLQPSFVKTLTDWIEVEL